MDFTKVEMRILVENIYMENNHALGEMKNLASEIQIKKPKGIFVSKEYNIWKLFFSIKNMKEENKTRK